jgi:adenylate cyclase
VEEARKILLGTHPALRQGRRILGRLPASPRCKLCAGPFKGPGGVLMRAVGKGPWPKNPKYCTACFREMSQYRVGAEIECSLVFADVRGSTPMAERMRPAAFGALMNRFFEVAARELVEHDGIVDKFVGDEVIGIFIPAFAGETHAAHAISRARHLLGAVRAEARRAGETELPVGAGVHTGIAFVGAVGGGDNVEVTAMGDPVNLTARLASAAGAGEVLVTTAAAEAAGLDTGGAERRELALRGRSEPVEVLVLGPAA